MNLDRREFLKYMGLVAGAAAAGGCTGSSLEERLVEYALRGPGIETFRRTICGLCGAGCGVSVRLIDDIPVGLKGNPRHPLNRGGLCPVGLSGLEVLFGPRRLRQPLRRDRDGAHRPVTWDEALQEIAQRIGGLIGRRAGNRIAFICEEPGQLFHELVVHLAHALGSASVARRADPQVLPFYLTQGLERPPGFDLAGCDLVLAFGLDIFEDGPAPIHAISTVSGSRGTDRRCEMLHAGTRWSPSAAKAEEHLPIHPGTHGALALGIAHVLVREGRYDRRFVAEHTWGFEDWIDEAGRRRMGMRTLLLERYYPDRVARICGCDPARIVGFAHRLARASSPLALAGGEATAATNATWTMMAVHALNALTGAFDRPGGVVAPQVIPFTALDPPARPAPDAALSIFAPASDDAALALDPVETLAERIRAGTHEVDVLFLVHADPLFESPHGERFRAALERIPLVVAMTPVLDETATCAHLVLPTSLFFESWMESTTPPTVGFSVLGISQPIIEPLHDTRHPGDIFLQLAAHLGPAVREACPWDEYVRYLQQRLEGLLVSGQGAIVSGAFEESWVHFLEERGWRFLEHRDVAQFWDALIREGGWWNPVRSRGDWKRIFRTASGRYEFHSSILEKHLRDAGARAGALPGSDDALERGARALGLQAGVEEVCLPHHEPPALAGEGELILVPFRPITARGRLGAASPMVLEMFGYPILSGWETWVELAPATAEEKGLRDGDLVEVASERDSFQAVLHVQAGALPGVVHVPLGLGQPDPVRPGDTIGANPVKLLPPERDRLGGGPALLSTRVRLRLVERRRHGGLAPREGGDA